MNSKVSLIPYLNRSESNVYLNISLISHDSLTLEKAPCPFLLISASDPLTKLVEANFETDAGSELKKVFLLIQRDQYLVSKDELWPFTNRDIEEFWQKAFSFYTKAKQGDFPILLFNQINERGKLIPFQSLFFCKKRQIYFHPPCPKCGHFLQQCNNDEILLNSRLQPFSSTLKRYLFCPSCISTGNSDFYVYELDHSDPSSLKDRITLIKEFSFLLNSKNLSAQMPCYECVNRQECYGPDQKVLLRLVPFSFYPFYMLIFEAMTLHAIDFLSLISGASSQELVSQLEAQQESGRIRFVKHLKQDDMLKTPLFFQGNERYFLEILYLKLSFLAEIAKTLFARADLFSHPDFRMSIERIWIKLFVNDALLPFFWNFRLKVFDISTSLFKVPAFPNLIAPSSLFSLGFTWFYTFLVNSQQSFTKIISEFKETFESLTGDNELSFQNIYKNGKNNVFSPENIFWNPKNRSLNKNWHGLWEKSLGLGWTLLKTGFLGTANWSKDTFWNQIEDLREEVKMHLFPEPSEQSSFIEYKELDKIDNTIHTIIMEIVHKWRSEMEEETEKLKETVIISPESEGKGIPTLITEIDEPINQEEDAITETVILGHKADERLSLQHRPQEDEEILTETVILGHAEDKSAADKFKHSKKLDQKNGDVSEKDVDNDTVIIKNRGEALEEESLAETVILEPDKFPDRKKRKEHGPADSFRRISKRSKDNL